MAYMMYGWGQHFSEMFSPESNVKQKKNTLKFGQYAPSNQQ
jgi:hypothetical protein